MSKGLKNCLCLSDFEARARKILPRPVYGYIAATAEDSRSFRNNFESFKAYSFVTKTFVDVLKRDTRTRLFDREWALPFGMAPVGLSALYTYRGDVALASVAQRKQIPMIMSGSSLIPLEEVPKANPDAWFQAYLPSEPDKMKALIDRVIRAGFKTLVVTADTPVNPNKENFLRAGFTSPLKPSIGLAWQGLSHPQWLVNTFGKTVLRHGIPHFENNYATRGVAIIARNVERSFSDRGGMTWDSFSGIRKLWPHRLVLKGVLSAEDAVTAADRGAQGVILSNHGGRQLDCAIAPLTILPEVVKRCPSIPVMIDGGIRRGSDVIKCLALGASFVFVGRPFVYAAAAGGVPGIEKAVDLLAAEIDRNLAMLGIPDIGDLTPDCMIRDGDGNVPVPGQRGAGNSAAAEPMPRLSSRRAL